MNQLRAMVLALLLTAGLAASAVAAVSASAVLNRVRAAEATVRDIQAEMVITDADKGNVSDMGKGYGDILMLQKATMYYKKPDMIRMDGFASNIKATYIQNGYKKLILAAMIRKTEDVKDAPGKRWDTLDLGFLSSRLWDENYVSVVSSDKSGILKMKFDPKYGDKDKRHDMVWVDSGTLKVLKREKYRGSGELRVKYTYGSFKMLEGKLPIATVSKLYNGKGQELGTVSYSSVKSNVGLKDSLFSLSTR